MGIYNALKFLGNEPFWLINADLFTNYKININKKLLDNTYCHLILVKNPNHNKSGDFDLQKVKSFSINLGIKSIRLVV